MNTGLRLMINEDRRGGFWQVVDNLRAGGHLKIYALILVGVIPGHDRADVVRSPLRQGLSAGMVQGVSDSFYHVMSL